MQPPTGPWFIPKRVVETNSDAIKLFCLPQAGMGAWAYQSWSERLAPQIQVLPIELPGHGSRMREPRVTDLCQLSCQIADVICSSTSSGSYALFGHSMGAWIAWEVLQEISRRGWPVPLRLFVSGNRCARPGCSQQQPWAYSTPPAQVAGGQSITFGKRAVFMLWMTITGSGLPTGCAGQRATQQRLCHTCLRSNKVVHVEDA
eukprot:GHUV01023314.1.p1 GENE.GHUV01023314.1~~GHUV01023314.1.p1  ORF type:complete len:203 (+),score=34.45 GHUV01023314.1:785-1393(+)